MPKIDKQVNHDLTYRYETFAEYKQRRIDDEYRKLSGMTQSEYLQFASTPEYLKRSPLLNYRDALHLADTVHRGKWNKRVNRAYDSLKQRTFDSKSYEVPVSASLGIVGSDSPVQTNVSWEAPTEGVDYSGQKRKKGSGISYNLGLF